MFQNFLINVTLAIMNMVWSSPYGRAILLQTWEEYHKSILFEEREKAFGKLEAARMINWSEWNHFKRKVLKNFKFWLSIIPWPYDFLDRASEKNYAYRMATALSLYDKAG